MAGNNVNDSYRSAPTTVIPSANSSTYQDEADALFLGYMLQNYPIAPNDTDTQNTLLSLYPLSEFSNNNYWRVSQGIQDAGVAW